MEGKLLALSGLMDEPHFRRLIKFQARRRQCLGGSDVEILTETVHVLMCDDPQVSFTAYRMRIRSAEDVLHHTTFSRDRDSDEGGRWVLEKRYSEFDKFRKQFLKHIEHWENVVNVDLSHRKAKEIVTGHGDVRTTFAVVSNALRRAISPHFPKKHICVDTPKIIAERVEGLTEFVRKIASVYIDLGLYLSNNQLHSNTFASSFALLHHMQVEIEEFLRVPQPQKDAEIRRQSAVLALENLDALPDSSEDDNSSEPVCCICLNEEDPVDTEKVTLVQLPCRHHFHEDCVIDWFTKNAMAVSVIDDKLLATSGLMNEPRFRRLIKFQTRRREALVGSELEIRTTTRYALVSEDKPNVGFTIYYMHIHRASDTRGDEDQWVLKKRYSELEAFRRLLFKRIEDWEYTVRREFSRKTSVDKLTTFAVMSNAMRRAISPSFPRKRMRPAKPAVIKERTMRLPNFVRKLLGVYTDLSVYKTNSSLQAGGFASSWAQLCTIFSELESFLEIPQPQKDAEVQRQSAVLALRDFNDSTSTMDEDAHDQSCSICLNEDPVTDETRPAVALPCGHHFHEDCVIDWFSTSITCPLCRRRSHI
ncbi:hypothetical protein PInf_016963 [Phytophthora infestans]|nr:hypothetical protein PInf_016963 [Phytophthora infestans]